jgi:peptidoglycan/xylan/chitin deacetylase (PgdA/CDA1 family)
MSRTGAPTALALRVDVDFPVGLERAVPRMLDRLRAAGHRATFFVVAGRNRATRSLGRLRHADYRLRVRRLGPVGIARQLGGSLLGGSRFLVSSGQRRSLRRIVAEGHELAAHGWDHGWWADHVWSASTERLTEEIDRARLELSRAAGLTPTAWGAPAWRTTEPVLHALARRGVPYLADCWGDRPFVTIDDRGEEIALPHLPVTLASLESLILDGGLDRDEAVRVALAPHATGRTDVLCVHDYFEGLLRPELFDRLLAACERRGRRFVSLAEAAAPLARSLDRLPRHRLERGVLAGFFGEVSRQAAVAKPVGNPAVARHEALH